MVIRKIYVASSWRNVHQQRVVGYLRSEGHHVYDYRNPKPGNSGFAWGEIDREWLSWTPENFAKELKTSKIAHDGFALDKDALDWCDTCVLVLPCGRSAHLELGYVAGQGKETYVLLNEEKFEPELMYLLADGVYTDMWEIKHALEKNPLDVRAWHGSRGGYFGMPSAHALRLLREVIELCIASGAERGPLERVAKEELDKGEMRQELGGADHERIAQEWADCALLLEVFRHYSKIDSRKEIRKKLAVLYDRKWKADEAGVLWRPGEEK
ncbi:MAG TPA: hypothetical protein VET48_04940 [Steroidobacteraceae bacterium]|nr:hypothetical protein [Steroidobacteraceae bacterium]